MSDETIFYVCNECKQTLIYLDDNPPKSIPNPKKEQECFFYCHECFSNKRVVDDEVQSTNQDGQ
jgi:hypothetical protein